MLQQKTPRLLFIKAENIILPLYLTHKSKGIYEWKCFGNFFSCDADELISRPELLLECEKDFVAESEKKKFLNKVVKKAQTAISMRNLMIYNNLDSLFFLTYHINFSSCPRQITSERELVNFCNEMRDFYAKGDRYASIILSQKVKDFTRKFNDEDEVVIKCNKGFLYEIDYGEKTKLTWTDDISQAKVMSFNNAMKIYADERYKYLICANTHIQSYIEK